MMKNTPLQGLIFAILLLFSLNLIAQDKAFETPFEKDNNTTATYRQTIDFYKKLAASFPRLQLKEWGSTDSGFPLHTAVLSTSGDFNPASVKKSGKVVLFINNAIHPGEPCGVDASMMLIRDFLQKPDLQRLLEHVVLVAIPFYNIGGGLNRGSFSRANQSGPAAYGFRGNAKNLDLNRDFIKCDSKNGKTINQIFNYWQPDVFLDNHTSDGADYSYTMTLIATQKDKLNPVLSTYLQDELLPHLYKGMKAQNWEMTPYVHVRNTPDEGIAGFLDLPRYSSGYAALHNTISFIGETHMLKPFKDRVRSTYAFMAALIKEMQADFEKIAALRKQAIQRDMERDSFELNWSLDRSKKEKLLFKGYEAKHKPSEISGLDRLYYDRTEPYEKEVPFFNTYQPVLKVEKPVAYLIPQAYSKVVERLRWNGVQVRRLKKDAEVELEVYYIEDFKTRNAYEGHYLHYDVEVEKRKMNRTYHPGDYVVFMNQVANRYLIETLEPQAPDSYFCWNFFDGILMQKEYFSSYVFEDLAAAYLKAHPDLKAQLEAKKKENEDFAKNARAQLDFVYKHSPYYERTCKLYPVGRLLKNTDLPLE